MTQVCLKYTKSSQYIMAYLDLRSEYPWLNNYSIGKTSETDF